MDSFAQRATLPFRIMVAPRRAFQHECRPTRILTTTPWSVLIWTIVWFALLVLVSIGVRYGLDRAAGMRWAVGSYWNPHLAVRFGSLAFAPLHLILTWAECAFVALVGMAISFRWLTPRQVVRLTIWLLPFALGAAIFAILCEAMYDHVVTRLIIGQLAEHLSGWAGRQVMRWSRDLSVRSFDIALGLLAGIAVGTLVKRRRWLIPPLAATALTFAFPILFGIQRQTWITVYDPIIEAIYGPPQFPSRLPLAIGPTFTVGITAPSLAGTWHLEYTTGDVSHTQQITIDANGSIAAVEQRKANSEQSIRFVADGQFHELKTPATAAGDVSRYRVLGSCERFDEHVTINLRFEYVIERTKDNVLHGMPVDSEEKLTGILADDNVTITGTSHYRLEAPGINFDPDHLDRDFVMRRTATATQPTTTATTRSTERYNQP
ncbi:MAG: hypothetical protein JXA69_18180 [Phycisphaerae bacterium]|nr:hypothetical protein [Phycisphaerae bacterium]